MAGIIEVKDQGKLRIYDADNSHYTDIVVPSSVTANRTITLPDASFTVPTADTVGGITMADMFRLTAVKNNNSAITANLERCDEASFGRIGTGMSQSSGLFTFPATGIYQVLVSATIRSVSDNNSMLVTEVTRNNGTAFADVAYLNTGNATSSIVTATVSGSALIDVTDVGQVKVRFYATSLATTNCFISGNTAYNETSFSFIRLGDT